METYKIFNNLLTVLIILTYNNNNVIFASEVTCSLEDYILTGIEFRQCQSKILDTFETARGGNPCKLIKSIVDSCSTIVKVRNVYYYFLAEFISFVSGKIDLRIFFTHDICKKKTGNVFLLPKNCPTDFFLEKTDHI